MVLTVDDYAAVRLAHRNGMGVHDLARTFPHSKRKIQEILDPYKPIIDGILQADEQAPRKQRHTAAKIFRRLHTE